MVDSDASDVTSHHGGIIQNSSGATSGMPFQVTGLTVGGIRGSLQINNGGRYVHNTLAGHFNGEGGNGLLDQLRQTPLGLLNSVAEGIFEFRVPTNGVYELSLGALDPAYIPNTLLLSWETAAGNTTYATTGPNYPVALKSNFVVGPNVTFSPSLTGQFQIAGNVTVDGTWRPVPPAGAGSGVASVNLNGNSPTTPQRISGLGTIDFSGGNGTNLVVSNAGGTARTGPGVVLSMDINLNRGALSGSGRFELLSNGKFTTHGASRIFGDGGLARLSLFSTLTTEHPDGVAGCLATGGPNVFDPRVNYVFQGNSVQNTGFPANLASAASVRIANATPPTGVTLNRSITLVNGDDTPPTLTVDEDAILTAGTFTVGGAGGGATFGANATLSTANAGGVRGTLPGFASLNFSPGNDNNFVFNGITDQPVNGMPAVVRNLTIANVNAGAVILEDNTTVNGTLALNAGRLTIGPRVLTLNGTAVRNSGTLTGGEESDVVVGGRGALGTLAFTAGSQLLRSLTMDRADNGPERGSVTLGSPLAIGTPVVAGTLALTAGLVTTGPANLLTLAAGATVTGGSARSYVNGPVARVTNAAAGYALPTGKDGIYAPVGLTTQTNAPTTYTAEYFKSDASSAPAPCPCNTNTVDRPKLSRVSTVEHWTVARSGESAATVTLPWGPHSGVESEGSLTVAYWNQQWVDTYAEPETSPGGVPNATGGTVTSPFVNAFGAFTLGDYGFNPLPVTLISFTGRAQGPLARLAWTTASEVNNAGFYVEKSLAARSFERIGFVAAGQPAGRHTYHFDDPQFTRDSYYRLRQVDENGRTAYSKTVFVAFQENGLSGFVFPNPTNGEISLRFPDPAREVELRLFSASGARLRTFRSGAQRLQADLSEMLRQLPAGLYWLTAQQGGQHYRTKLVKR